MTQEQTPVSIDLGDESLQGMPGEELELRITDWSSVTFRVPLPSINRANQNIDIAYDYLYASYGVELLSKNCAECSLKFVWETEFFPCLHLTLINPPRQKMPELVSQVIWAFQAPEAYEYEEDYQAVLGAIEEYEEALIETPLKFPEIIEQYFANLIAGAYFQMEEEFSEAAIKDFPERTFGFWASAYYNGAPHKVYVSTDAWIIPEELSAEDVFEKFAHGARISLLNASLILTEGKILAVSEGVVLETSLHAVLRTLSCAEEIFYRKEGGFDFKFGLWRGNLKCYVSEYHDFMILDSGLAKSVIFAVRVLKGNDLPNLAGSLGNLGALIGDGVLSDSKISLPWEELNDELFEQLCYDVVYHNSKFDRSTIRKMGKSRSRDGGRDIVVQTKARPGEESKKYIFQCKFYKRDGSANTSNVSSISDVIDQYGAQGYGLMCSCFIDSTLYDRLDGIAEHRKIETETWSVLELERYIARRPHLRDRFFSK